MFWFYFHLVHAAYKHNLFQYILCFGSINNPAKVPFTPDYFNTSYVLVLFIRGLLTFQVLLFQYILCFGSIFVRESPEFHGELFQYILCFGSMRAALDVKVGTKVFQYILCFGSICYELKSLCLFSISIHLMFWFYVWGKFIMYKVINFNTSYVLVLLAPTVTRIRDIKFQYILCFGSIHDGGYRSLKHVISIHLMFWFYTSTINSSSSALDFNTSYVLVLFLLLWGKNIRSTDFNTSYVLVL